MKVILTKNVPSQGKAGDLIDVSDGYAVNYLIKNKLAIEATSAKINEINQQRAAKEHKLAMEKEFWKGQAKVLSDTVVNLKVKAGAGGKVFGSIQSANISDELKKMGIDLDKKKIVLPDPIKNIGTYHVEVRPYPEISAKITVVVTQSE